MCIVSLFFGKALRLKEKADRSDDPGSGSEKNHWYDLR